MISLKITWKNNFTIYINKYFLYDITSYINKYFIRDL